MIVLNRSESWNWFLHNLVKNPKIPRTQKWKSFYILSKIFLSSFWMQAVQMCAMVFMRTIIVARLRAITKSIILRIKKIDIFHWLNYYLRNRGKCLISSWVAIIWFCDEFFVFVHFCILFKRWFSRPWKYF